MLRLAATLLLLAGPTLAAEERVPSDEAEDVGRVIEAMADMQEARLRALGKPALRATHAKAQGCLRGEFVVLPDVPERARHGVFHEPGKVYPAWLRVSSGSGEPKPDTEPDGHGVALKLMGVSGARLAGSPGAQNQDFVFNLVPFFFARDAKEAAELFEAMAEGRAKSYFFPGANPLRWRLREALLLRRSLARLPADPLDVAYFSALPARLGPEAVKYALRPCQPDPPPFAPPDDLAAALRARLARGPACLRLSVQWRVDGMPVEDATALWDERRAPFVPVAELRIPSQAFDAPRRRAFCEALSFNPWHGLEAHRPLGGIQRLRRDVYAALLRFREMKNGVSAREPRPDDLE